MEASAWLILLGVAVLAGMVLWISRAAERAEIECAKLKLERIAVPVQFRVQRLHGKGFGACMQATEGDDYVVIADMHAILWSSLDGGGNWKDIATDTVVHEMLHVVQGVLGRAFDEDEVEASIVAVREQIRRKEESQ